MRDVDGRRPSLLLATTVVAAIALAACASTPQPSGAVSPVSSARPSGSLATGPTPSIAGTPYPDVSSDPLEASPALPTFQPPVAPSPAAVTHGWALHVPVLMYHRIIPPALAGDSLPGLVVQPALFAAQMNALAKAGWHTITAAQLATDLAQARRPAPRTFVITFDDGYDDGYTYALPILQAHRFVATYYVIAGRIGNAAGPLQALTPAHVQALAAAGMEIGNHTFNHVDLATASPATLVYQVVAASARIAALTGTAPQTLAYPFGGWSVAAEAECRAAGMSIAFTTVEGAREAWSTRFASPRVRVGPATTPAQLLGLVELYSAPAG